MEIVSPPPHVVQTWTEVTVGCRGGDRGGEHDFTLKLDHGDVFINTPDRLAVTEVVGFIAPVLWEFSRAWVQFVRICIRQVAVDPTTGREIKLVKGPARGET